MGAGMLSPCIDVLRIGRMGFNSRQGQEIILYFTASRPAVGSTQPPNSENVKRPGREDDHSPLSSADIKNGGAATPLSHNSL
jgi:hypothetical protein